MILCVLKTGGEYNAGHVERLRAQVADHAPGIEFRCLTDDPAVPGGVPLEHGWPGWFSKLELFGVQGPCLYLDLDVTVTGDLALLLDAAAQHDLVMCRGFHGDDDPNPFNSSVMGWCGDLGYLRDLFASDPDRWIARHALRTSWGDQGFIIDHVVGRRIETWQDLLPGMVLSYKRGVLMGEDASDMRVCVYHGQPKPWHLSSTC